MAEPKGALDRIAEADALLFSGKVEEARRVIREVVAANRDAIPVPATVVLIACAFVDENYAAARQLAETVMSHVPDTSMPALPRMRLLACAAAGDFDAGLAAYGPYFRSRIDPARDKEPWYDASVVGAPGPLARSQELGQTIDEFSAEHPQVVAALELRAHDAALDVGGSNLGLAIEGLYDKVLVPTVTPFMPSTAALHAALATVSGHLRAGGRCLVTDNYDLASAENALRTWLPQQFERPAPSFANFRAIEADKAYRRTPAFLTRLMSQLHLLENILWIDVPSLADHCEQAGFTGVDVIHTRDLPDGRTTFDLLLVK